MNLLISKLKNIKTWISFVIVITLFYILFSQLNPYDFIKVVSNANIFLFFSALLIFFGVFPFLALRWSILLKNVGLKVNFSDLNTFILLQWFVNSVIPAKIGDLYKAYLIKKHHQISMSKIIGTIFVERLFDLIFVALLSIISAWVVFKGAFPEVVVLPTEILILFIIFLLVLIFLINLLKNSIIRILPKRIKKVFGNFEDGVSKCVKIRNIPLLSIYSFFPLFIQVLVTYLIAISLGLDISLVEASFVTMVSGLVTMIPLTPAGVGFGELTFAAIFLMLNVEKNLAISAAILIRATYWALLIVGGIVYLKTPKK